MAVASVVSACRVFSRRIAIAGLAFVMSAPTVADARQSAGGTSSAGIIGRVTDSSGGIMPGVTVTATSPALQVPSVVVVTDAQGEYRLMPLPTGSYSVEYALQGFKTLRIENVQLPLGFVAKLDQVIEVGLLKETVTVVGSSPLVDTTQAAAVTTLGSEAIALLPMARNGMSSFLAQVPGMRSTRDVGGSNMSDQDAFRSYGQTGSAWFLLEGVLAGSINAANGSHYDFNSIEGARAQTIGNEAEMPRRGVLIDLITKSGGNDYHGDLQWAQTHQKLQSDNVDDELRAKGVRGTTRLDRRWDGAAALGGKLIENRMWFYTAFRHRQFDKELLGAFYPDGAPVVGTNWQAFQTYKLSTQLTTNSKVVGFYHWSGQNEFRGATQFVPPESMNLAKGRFTTGKVEWQATRADWLAVSLQYGQWRWHSTYEGFAPGKPLAVDIVTLQESGDAFGGDGFVNHNFTRHIRGLATMYKPDLFKGNHEFKIGFDNLLAMAAPERAARRSGDYQLRFSSGAPFQINTFNNPVIPRTDQVYLGVYGQDAWTLARRLTLNLGIRAAYDNAYVPEQCQLAGQFATAECYPKVQPNIWKTVAPRMHAVYDLTGQGRSLLKGGWGRFIHMREVGGYEITHLNKNAFRTTTWTWRDLNGNRDYDAGEVNLNPNGPDFVAFVNLTEGIVNPNERIPKSDEFSLSFEQQLVGDLAIRVTGMYVRNKNVNRFLNPFLPYGVYNIPITNLDPGPDGVLGNADDTGQPFTYYDFPAALRGARFQTLQLVNDDAKNDTSYKTIEVAATKRLAKNWQLAASYSATRNHVPFGDGATTGLILNPNAEVNSVDNTLIWISKMSGSYQFPKGIIGSVNYDLRSGTPLARQVLFRGGVSIPSIALNVEEIGSISLPATGLLDVRGAKEFAFGNGRRFEITVDCFNALNTNDETAITVRAGSTYLVPTAITLPRILQIGGRFRF